MSMDKFKDIFKAMSEGALLEVSLSLGEWSLALNCTKEADYQIVCRLIANGSKFSCRIAHDRRKHADITFPAPVTDVSELSREGENRDGGYVEYYVYYYPDTANCEVVRVAWKANHSDQNRMENGLIYRNREDAEARLNAMLRVEIGTVRTVIYNGLDTN